MTDLRILDNEKYQAELGILVDRIKIDLETLAIVDQIVHKCLVGVYLKK